MKLRYPRGFPILYQGFERKQGWPTHIAWDMVDPHEEQARQNHHGQTLQRLAERGGLSPFELFCLLNDQTLRWDKAQKLGDTGAMRYILKYWVHYCEKEDGDGEHRRKPTLT